MADCDCLNKSVYYIVQCTIGILSLWYLTNYRMLKYSACKSVLQDELMLINVNNRELIIRKYNGDDKTSNLSKATTTAFFGRFLHHRLHNYKVSCFIGTVNHVTLCTCT